MTNYRTEIVRNRRTGLSKVIVRDLATDIPVHRTKPHRQPVDAITKALRWIQAAA